jgi:hypothetical protein
MSASPDRSPDSNELAEHELLIVHSHREDDGRYIVEGRCLCGEGPFTGMSTVSFRIARSHVSQSPYKKHLEAQVKKASS